MLTYSLRRARGGFATNLVIGTDLPIFKIYLIALYIKVGWMNQRVLVANMATDLRMLVASTENLGVLATVSGAISCPA